MGTHTIIERTREQVGKKYAELVEWASSGDVDSGVFKAEVDSLLVKTFHANGLRIPYGVSGRGVLTLDVVASFLGEWTPLRRPGLPGARELADLEGDVELATCRPTMVEARRRIDEDLAVQDRIAAKNRK